MLSYRQIFGGNVDENTPEYNFLHPHIEATYIRFHPWTWHSHISMRAEVYGCNGNLLLVGSIHSKSGIFQDTKYKYNFVIERNGAFCFRFFSHFLVLFFLYTFMFLCATAHFNLKAEKKLLVYRHYNVKRFFSCIVIMKI